MADSIPAGKEELCIKLNKMNKISVGIIDDNVKIAEQLVQKLEFVEEAEIWFVLHSGKDALEWMMADHEHPDILLMDISMPGMDGIETTFRIRQSYPDQKVLMLTVFEDEENIFRAMQAGATGYLLKDEKLDRMLQAFHEILEGGVPMSPAVASRALNMMISGYKPDKKLLVSTHEEEKLSKRETEILELLAKGLQNKEVAVQLFISDATVKKHIENIYAKLQLRSRVELVNWYNRSAKI